MLRAKGSGVLGFGMFRNLSKSIGHGCLRKDVPGLGRYHVVLERTGTIHQVQARRRCADFPQSAILSRSSRSVIRRTRGPGRYARALVSILDELVADGEQEARQDWAQDPVRDPHRHMAPEPHPRDGADQQRAKELEIYSSQPQI